MQIKFADPQGSYAEITGVMMYAGLAIFPDGTLRALTLGNDFDVVLDNMKHHGTAAENFFIMPVMPLIWNSKTGSYEASPTSLEASAELQAAANVDLLLTDNSVANPVTSVTVSDDNPMV